MSLPLTVPAGLVRDAIAKIASDGSLQPVTSSMRDWIAEVSDDSGPIGLEQLPLDEDQQIALADGESVMMATSHDHWQLQKVVVDDADWLVVTDVAERERYVTASLSAARNRSLGGVAGAVAHDLNNQFSLVLALSACLEEFVQDDAERATIRELELEARSGSHMVTALARLLVRPSRTRELFSPSEMLEDAMSVMSKQLQQDGAILEVDVAEGLPSIRGSSVEVVQSVVCILQAFGGLEVTSIRSTMSSEPYAIAGGRRRDCVVWRCLAGPWHEDAMAPMLAVLNADPCHLPHVASNPGILTGVANALFVQKRMGGDIQAKREGDLLSLTLVWPAARA